MVGQQLDWGSVIAAVIPTIPAALAYLHSRNVAKQVQTPSGKPLGEVAEYAHDTAIANNLLLSKANGPTKTADPEALKETGSTPPQVPSNHEGA